MTGGDHLEGRLDIGGGYYVRYATPVTFAAPYSGPGIGPWDVQLFLAPHAGRLICNEIRIKQVPGGPPVDASALARVQVVRLLKLAAQIGRDVTSEGVLELPPIYRAGADEVVQLDDLSEPERVTLIYRVALAFGEAPTKAVAKHLGVSAAVAAKRVQAARRDGLLESTTPGKKGR